MRRLRLLEKYRQSPLEATGLAFRFRNLFLGSLASAPGCTEEKDRLEKPPLRCAVLFPELCRILIRCCQRPRLVTFQADEPPTHKPRPTPSRRDVFFWSFASKDGSSNGSRAAKARDSSISSRWVTCAAPRCAAERRVGAECRHVQTEQKELLSFWPRVPSPRVLRGISISLRRNSKQPALRSRRGREDPIEPSAVEESSKLSSDFEAHCASTECSAAAKSARPAAAGRRRQHCNV